MTELLLLAVFLGAAVLVGLVIRSRQGRVRSRPEAVPVADDRRRSLVDAGVDPAATEPVAGAVVLHFSADWCGPCAAVRRVVAQVLDDLAATPHPPVEVELDIDEHASLAKELGVLSLPTTFILDRDLTERFRVSGVPTAVDLRTALTPLSEAQPDADQPGA